ncbi:MAG: TolC family protein, partial [Chitinophagaceae bacterium]
LMADTVLLNEHPELKAIRQQQQIADATIQVEKSRLLPDLSFGYNNVSIQGTGADDKIYSSSKRFNSVQLGIGIPIFNTAQKAKINSAILNKKVAENNYSAGLQMLQTEYQAAIAQYYKYLQTVQYFESKALNNALVIVATANLQLANGIINYLEWVQVINQATAVKSDYIEAVRGLNESVIQLNYYINK